MAQLPPAGWHPDPLGRHAQRYWDGQQWTEHVADQAGNMTTDPLDGGGQGQQAQQAASQEDGQQPATTGSGAEDTGGQAWGSGGQWGDATTATPDASTGQGGQAAGSGFESAWGAAGAAAAGTATAAGTAGGATADTAEATTTPGTASVDDTVADDEAAADDFAADDLAADEGAREGAWSAGVVALEVDDDDPIVADPGALVARQSGVVATEVEHGHRLAGAGTVWLGGAGREVTIVTLQDPGLTVDRGALVAHSAGLERAEAHPGIVGFTAVRLSGAGWVALAAAGGLAEVPTDGGVEVASGALVAFTNDLDVSHADTVALDGHGVALVSGG
jgi:hypothetical protein